MCIRMDTDVHVHGCRVRCHGNQGCEMARRARGVARQGGLGALLCRFNIILVKDTCPPLGNLWREMRRRPLARGLCYVFSKLYGNC